ncbi:protein of unknown function [Shewanella benthica]|uniref:Uncharacterized protein n=1 Tax=Shewanella benthica TaxID=43661 RepID=A0A330M5R7_9GAMM|nr:protein of unknown function [Shewanella benthica]
MNVGALFACFNQSRLKRAPTTNVGELLDCVGLALARRRINQNSFAAKACSYNECW